MDATTRAEAVRHRVAVPVAVAATVASMVGWSPSPIAALAAVAAAAVIGMPHGALDVVVGPRLFTAGAFSLGYLLLGAATVAVWFVAPVVALLAFLAMSWWHFGTGDADHHHALEGRRFGVGAATAGLVLGLPMLLHRDVVSPIIDDLLGADVSLSNATVFATGAVFCIGVVAALAFAGPTIVRTRAWRVVVEVGVIGALAAVVHPLVSFAIYFACWHSPRHVIALAIDRSALRPALVASLATIAAAVVAWIVLTPSAAVTAQVVLIGLSALTTPHLLVTDLGRNAALRRSINSIELLNPFTASPAGASTKA